ncbi:bifunctional tRNA (5-methylaminomethyl-2-thiouridine)(34)-methyltransferase MnmD/FAD-dependent 5-carboxymethylaminomethyl-2-thiouridine(34) oxidoreductase MnmC [uncultured Marinobacter sp.]|uniref:bifunctional tRNA (5-methylaminomethyl-2-thiouridine)(34)-methyltransferase MnmD/FAD-dependent 5-carboxymethylaminomethyl-2-thiouridine(34) oxidoreductase MnmC n=1 Tax=uncultured Marinobacter sp. TaxID=187379 RepID=UPI00263279EC|nr:bifunctional tRNA (5-methylaminomethyl-2-thiouridine)(34)-methyltransferase MnmD/FAD-dependent 5-carboxymethylaminomethyl-2-thiouridine(34) oxidoreductase MnmC [uncultured Marinobacter sp.]
MTEVTAPAIEPADILWQDGVPESRLFGDVYFNRDNGLEETRYVFIRPNRLSERFARLPDNSAFVIAESGFGTGLNFLAAWQSWRNSPASHRTTLHFVSAERYPLSKDDLARALTLWPELQELGDELIQHYPPLVRGVHRVLLDGGRVRLTLYFGDVLDAWRELEFAADAWFLDGFAPSLNPGMWLDDAIHQIRRHSKPGTTLSTFTAVGRIRRALADTGFTMTKVAGFGRKRDMLAGMIPESASGTPEAGSEKPGSVAIIGAGIAGSLLAHNLAKRGVQVTLVDGARDAGTAASGNLQGALYVKLGVEFNAQTQLALSSLLFSQRFYEPFRNSGWHPTGLLQMAWGPQERQRQERFLGRNQYPPEILAPVDTDEARRLTGTPVETGGLWYTHSGWLEPAALCKTLANHPNIQRCFGMEVQELVTRDGQWIIKGAGGDIQVDRVVLCSGHRTPELVPPEGMGGAFRFKAIRGQVSHLPEERIHAPKAVICGPRYLNPAHNGLCVTGATFDLHDLSPRESRTSHRENLTELTTMLPGLWKKEPPTDSETEMLEGRVGFRCTTHDYQPVAGSLNNLESNKLDGLFLFTGLGSKGLTYAPLLAEFLADKLTGQPVCLPHSLAKRVDPHRCYKREDAKAS